jgi:autotransporter-associated beta strand protein
MLFAAASTAARFTAEAPRAGSASARRALMRATAITGGVLGAMLVLAPASAQTTRDWLPNPVDNNLRNGANYNVPGAFGPGTENDVLVFGASTITSININTGPTQFGSLRFDANGPAYTITATGGFAWGWGEAGIVNGEKLTIVNAGDMQIINASTLGAATVTNNRTLRWNNSGTAGSATITTTDGNTFNGFGTRFLSTSNGGTSTHILTATGLLDITELTSTGTTIGSVEGTGLVGIGGKTLTIGSNNKSTTYSGVIQNRGNQAGSATLAGNLAKTGTGTLTLTGTNTYTGTTTVDGGTLLVNGSIATSSGLTVNNGGTIGGTGTVPVTTINSGGTLAPGSNGVGTLAVNGNLTLSTGATTLIEVQGATADRVNVTGTATLAGTVRFAALGGAYSFNSPYTFLQAASVTGTFSAQQVQGSFGEGVTATVGYTPTQAQLTLAPAPLVALVTRPALTPQAVSGNQLGVAGAIDRAVAAGGNASPFFNLFNQDRAGILTGLDQLSGVAHAGAPVLGNQASNTIISAIFNPVAAGRSTPSGSLVRSFAPQQEWSSGQRAINDALGFSDDLVANYTLAQNYSIWASLTGVTSRASGEAASGSPRVTSGFGGLTVGADFRVAPETVIGAAVAGATGSSSSGRGLGSVETDLLQLGLYGSTKLGALSLSAGGAWITGDVDGSRSIGVLGVVKARSDYNLQGFSGRFEAAFEVAKFAGLSASPYAAYQASSIRTSSFVERNEATGAAVGIQALAKTNTTARAELGLKLETAGQLGAMPATAFIRAGWGHYTSRDANVTAQLVGLPGSLFTATGTRPDSNVALVAAGGEVRVTSAVSVGGSVDAELGSRTQTVRGSANIKYAF